MSLHPQIRREHQQRRIRGVWKLGRSCGRLSFVNRDQQDWGDYRSRTAWSSGICKRKHPARRLSYARNLRRRDIFVQKPVLGSEGSYVWRRDSQVNHFHPEQCRCQSLWQGCHQCQFDTTGDGRQLQAIRKTWLSGRETVRSADRFPFCGSGADISRRLHAHNRHRQRRRCQDSQIWHNPWPFGTLPYRGLRMQDWQ